MSDSEDLDVFESDDGPDEITITSPNWHDYVMTKFEKEELVDIEGRPYPNVTGLRRVTEMMIGPIIDSRVVRYDKFDGDRATVQYEVIVQNNGFEKRVSDIADVSSNNCDRYFFEKFAVTTASTRAEGRCLRKLLRLRGACAEEMERSPTPTEFVNPDDNTNTNEIAESQIKCIDRLCQKMDINVHKFINTGSKNYKTINDVTTDVAKLMVKQLNVYINDSDEIPESVRGYDKNWSK